MSFAGTPLGQGRRLDHSTFLGKQPTQTARAIPTSYSYGAPTAESRSPPRQPTVPGNTDDDPDEDHASALAKFAKIKQREAINSRPGAPKIFTSLPQNDKWAVKDTSVILASALHIAAKNDMIPATNPNNAWASGVTRPNPTVPRSTSVEYEKETQTTTTRRLAPPPNRFSRPPPVRKPVSKSASVRVVPDSQGEEDTSASAPANGRGKSPFEHVIDVAKKLVKPAAYYMRQLSNEPEDRSHSTNGNITHNRDTSYDYAAEEQEFQAAQQAKRASLSAHKRGRMSMDNRAYKPTTSDAETDDDDYSGDDKRKKRRRKKKSEPVGGPLTTLPVLSADRKKKRKSRGTKSGAPGQDDEESESDDEPSIELESSQAQQRSSVVNSQQPLRLSGSAPPHDITMQDSSLDTPEQGLDSIPEVPEDIFESSRPRSQSREKSVSRRVPRSSSRTRREPTRFSIGGFLGGLVHGAIRGLVMIVKFVIYLVTSIFFVWGRILGTIYDVVFNRPVLWIRTTDMSPATALMKYFAFGALALAAWYASQEMDITSYLPSLPLFRPSLPVYTAPEVPAANIAELSDRLQRIEVALAVLSRDSEHTRAKTEDGARSYSELIGRLGALESRVTAESKRLVESEVKVKDALNLGSSVSSVKRDIEVLHTQLKAQEKQRQQDEKQNRMDHISDEEARAKLRALEDRVGTVEGSVKDAIELGKKAVSITANAKSPTIKVPGGQDLRSMITEIVDAAISLFSKDTIGKADFAMHSGGARIIPSLTSDSFKMQPNTLRSQIVGFFNGYGTSFGRPPVTALHHELHGGYCWPFAGSQAQLGVSLIAPVIIDEVTIDHVAKEIAINISSAPRKCEVWGLVEGAENEKKYLEIIEARENGIRTADGAVEEYPTTLPHNPPYIRIANFTYDIEASMNVQTFPVLEDVREKNMDFGIVVLRVLDNWGMEGYTCLYRFRVHGMTLSPIQIPEPIEEVAL